MTWPFGWVQSEHEDLFFHFSSLTTSFKILHWDSQSDKTKKKKKWGRRNLLKVKEEKFIKMEKKFMRQHQRTEKTWPFEENFQRFTKPQLLLLFLFFFKDLQILRNLPQNKGGFYFGWYIHLLAEIWYYRNDFGTASI